MFSLREFLKKGFLKAVGSMPTYKIILNATGWYEKEVLTLEDLEEISKAIDDYENLKEIEVVVEPEITEEMVQAVADAIVEEAEEREIPVEEVIEEIVEEEEEEE